MKIMNMKHGTNSVNSNLNGAFLISQILIKHFKKKKIKGNIIFLSSTYGIVGPDMSIYKGLSKKKIFMEVSSRLQHLQYIVQQNLA